MKYAIINNGKVENIVIADEAFGGNWVNIDALNPQPGMGWDYAGNSVFVEPAQPVQPPLINETEFLIDLGPFFDRFGPAKMAILTSSDAVVKAIMQDLSIRKWVDLKRADVFQALMYVGSVVPALTTELQSSIINDPVHPLENLALRTVYFR